MSAALARRVGRLEAERGAGQHCRLCELIALTVGATTAEAAALGRHTAHTLESLIRASFEDNAPITH